MNRYTFDDVPYPSGFTATGRTGQTLWLEDTKNTLAGTSYIIRNPTRTAGQIGDAFHFNEYREGVGFDGQDLPIPWSLSFWVKRNSNGSNTILLDSDDFSIKLEQFGTSSRVGFTEYGVADYNFDYSVPLNTWTHVALTASSTGTTLYEDGNLSGSLTNTISLPRRSLLSSQNNFSLDIDLDEMVIFGEELTASDISDIYKVQRPQHRYSFDEGTGTTVSDGVGSADGTVSGAIFVAGVRPTSKALEFDGSNDYVSVNISSLTGDFTVSAWIYKEQDQTSSSLVSGPTGALRVDQYQDTHDAGATAFGTADYASSYSIPTGQWVYVTYVQSSSNVRVYANGVLHSTINNTISLAGLNRFGNSFVNGSPSDHFDGRLDDLVIFDSALDFDEVSMLYALEAQ